jgi:hypothetical protein
MVMDGTRWTNNSPRVFARAPGSGLGSVSWTDNSPRVFARSPGAGMGLWPGPKNHPLNNNGPYGLVLTRGDDLSAFEAQAVDPRTQLAVDEDRIEARWRGFDVSVQPIEKGKVPSMLVKFYFTDRGVLTQAQLDAQLPAELKKAGLKVSSQTKLEAVPVTWRWQREGDMYYPVVSLPAQLAGTRYAGLAFNTSAGDQFKRPTAERLAALPSAVYVYTFVVTGTDNTFSDASGAATLSVMRSWLSKSPAGASSPGGAAVVLGSDASIFGPIPTPGPASVFGWGLLLVAAAVTYAASRDSK